MSDYISREDLIERLKKAKNSIPEVNPMMMNGCLCGLERAIRETTNIASADVVEQKHGKWIVSAYELPVGTHCDNCGWAWVDHIDAVKLNPIFSHIRTNYCPNCGSYMRQKDGDS